MLFRSTQPQPGAQYNQTNVIPFVISVDENASSVTANVSWDSTSQLVTLVFNGTQWYYNSTFSNTTQPGNYNITFSATDTNNNVVTSTSNFTITDILTPSVGSISPTADTQYNQSQNINISVNVTDYYFDSVETVIAQITYPNGTSVNYTLTEIGNSQIFNNLVFNSTIIGNYNITILANDTSGNLNNTGVSNFTINDTGFPSIT